MTAQEVKADAESEGSRFPMEVVTFKKFIIGDTPMEIRVGWRDDRVMEEYIYNRCSGGPENNIF